MTMTNGTNPSLNGKRHDEVQLRKLWNFARRNLLLALGIPVLTLLAAAVFTRMATPIYEASASVRIDQKRSNIAVLDVLKTLQSGSEINTEMEVFRSRTLAEDVVDSLDLNVDMKQPRRVPRSTVVAALNVAANAPKAEYRLERQSDGKFALANDNASARQSVAPGQTLRIAGGTITLAPKAGEYEEIVFKVLPFQEAVKNFRDEIEISRPNRDADIAVVHWAGTDPQLVRAVPNAMARRFIARRQAVQGTEARSTVNFLHEQIDTLTTQLNGAENRMKDFRQAGHVVSLEAEGKAQIGRLAELKGKRDVLNSERIALGKLMDQVTETPAAKAGDPAGYRRLVAFPTLFQNQAASELLRSLSEVENERSELMTRRTPDDPDVQVLTARIRELENQLRIITTTYLEGLTNSVASLDATLASYGPELSAVPAKEIEFARLLRQSKVLEDIYVLLQTRLKEAQIAAAIEDPSVRVVDPAVLPIKPISPKPGFNLFAALVLGLMMGVGAAFAREHMDDTIHTREDLQALIAGTPVLGLIPRIPEAVGATGPQRSTVFNRISRKTVQLNGDGAEHFAQRLVTNRDPRNPISEAYRSLRTNITFSRPDKTPKVLVFTSPTPGDGKSTTAANLAITLAQQELKTLLIDADMRRGELHQVFKTGREPGLSNVLLGRVRFADAVQHITVGNSGNLDFLATGTLPPNPAELLGSARMRALLEELDDKYDAIILDAPPLNLVTDAAILGTNADGVIMIARAGATEKRALSFAMDQIGTVRAPLLGAVLNDIDLKKERYYGSYGSASRYYYSSETAAAGN